MKEFVSLLPDVLQTVKDFGKLTEFVAFHERDLYKLKLFIFVK